MMCKLRLDIMYRSDDHKVNIMWNHNQVLAMKIQGFRCLFQITIELISEWNVRYLFFLHVTVVVSRASPDRENEVFIA